MSSYISNSLKKQVAERAGYRCEYCLLRESTSFFTFHVDHIISQKHGGPTALDNLAYGCPDCNHFKGSDIATISENDRDTIVRFFNPREDNWADHFELQEGAIYGKTPIGIATIKIFRFNDVERVIFRKALLAMKQWP